MIIPERIKAGLTFSIRLTSTALPAPDWSALLLLRGPGAIDVSATPDVSQHLFRVNAEDTALWVAGVYGWSIRAQRGDDVVEVGNGQTTIEGDFAASAPGADLRSHAQKVLAALDAVIENRATLDQQKYTINNRELWRTPLPELLAFRNQYRAQVRAELARARGNTSLFRQHKVTF